MGSEDGDFQELIDPEVDEDLEEPPMYKVMIHNDDYTTKEFVVGLLVSVFHKSMEDAAQLMFRVHQDGIGVCGVYPLDVAETKVNVSIAAARDNGFPLKLTLEEE